MQYKYLSEPQKPFFSVGKAIIALLIILFNFWSFDTFARPVNGYIYECSRDSDGFGVSMDLTSTPSVYYIGSSSSGSTNGKAIAFKSKYKFTSGYINAACLLTDEPAPQAETCYANNPSAVASMTITEKIDLPLYQSTDKLGFAGCLYSISYTDNNSKDWQGSCYDFSLTRVDIASDTSNTPPNLTAYECTEKPPEESCYVDNPAAVASFTINEKQSLPLSGVRFNFAGCAYNVQQTANTSKSWSGSCYDFTLTRYDIKTSASNNLPNLSACSVDSNPDQSDDENVQKVLNNQLPLASNQQQILDKQSQLSNQLSDFETNMTNNQNDLANKLDSIKNDSTNNKNELSNKLDAIKNNQNQMISNQDDIKSDVSQMSDDLEANDQEISDKLSELENGNGEQKAALKDINNTLKNNHSDIQSLINEPSLTTPQQHFDNGVDLLSSVGDDAATQELSSLDGVIDDLTKGPAGGENSKINATAVLPWQRQLNKYIPKASSCDLSLPNPITGGSIPFNTDWSVKLKSILAWVISFHTFLSLFEILFTPVKPKN